MARVARDDVLLDLRSFQRDVLAPQHRTGAEPINADVVDDIAEMAERTTAEHTIESIDAIVACRDALQANAAPQLALEHMMSRFLG